MTKISYPKDVAALTRGTDALLVVAPKKTLRKSVLQKLLDPAAAAAAVTLANQTAPGDQGATGSTLCDSGPATLLVGVLPDTVSRYNAPSRAESIRKVVAAANPGRTGGLAVLEQVEGLLETDE